MSTSLLKSITFVMLLAACTATSKNSKQVADNFSTDTTQPSITNIDKPLPLTDLPRTQDGAFILQPGFYETEFKTYCLQPGTPDPSSRDAYLQSPMTGYRKEIVESVLLNSRNKPQMDQRNVQLLLWSIVSNSDFNKLSPTVKSDAYQLLTPKQIFELKGGVVGVIKTVSSVMSPNNDMQRLFETTTSSYEAFEKIAVLRESSQIKRHGVKADQWYKQKENYYVRYLPLSYKKVRVQIYVPDGLLDSENKLNGEYMIYDPTGQQAIPAFTNAQRLGIGGPVLDIIKIVIQVNKKAPPQPKQAPDPKTRPKRDESVKQ